MTESNQIYSISTQKELSRKTSSKYKKNNYDWSIFIGKIKIKKKKMRQPGIEPGPTAWKAAILTFRLLSQLKIF